MQSALFVEETRAFGVNHQPSVHQVKTLQYNGYNIVHLTRDKQLNSKI